jgi:hypothetical protein
VRQSCASQTPKTAVSGGCQRFKNRLNKPNPLWRAGDLSSLLPVVLPIKVEEGEFVIGEAARADRILNSVAQMRGRFDS